MNLDNGEGIATRRMIIDSGVIVAPLVVVGVMPSIGQLMTCEGKQYVLTAFESNGDWRLSERITEGTQTKSAGADFSGCAGYQQSQRCLLPKRSGRRWATANHIASAIWNIEVRNKREGFLIDVTIDGKTFRSGVAYCSSLMTDGWVETTDRTEFIQHLTWQEEVKDA